MDIYNKLKQGQIGVMPTDTIYGLLGRALKKEVVERIYRVKGRQPDKPFIILISSIDDMVGFGIKISKKQIEILEKYWPGQISIILSCDNSDLEYLHRGSNSLAFRLPDKADLRKLISKTGPLVAPSANPEGQPPALTTEQAKQYFGDSVDFYCDEGELKSEPSTLIKLDESGNVEILRQGVVKI